MSDNLLTLTEIAEIVGVNKATVARRSRINDFFAGYANSGRGRSMKLYKPNALKLWGLNDYQVEKAREQKIRKRRNDQGRARKLSPEIERALVQDIKNRYLQQANKKNEKRACYLVCREYWDSGQIDKERFHDDYEKFAWYIYNNRLKRVDNYWKGYSLVQKWDRLHEHEFNMPASNNRQITLRWNLIELFYSAGLIGRGFGAADLWIVDATELDTFTDRDKKADYDIGKPLYYLTIQCGFTGYPLYVQPLRQKSETIKEVNEAFARAYLRWGVPRYGIVLDNSRTFRSPMVKNFLKSFYTKGELQNFKKIFPEFYENLRSVKKHKDYPLIYNLPNIPRFPMKASVERYFKLHKDEFAATEFPETFKGGNRREVTRRTVSNTPMLAIRSAPELVVVWNKMLDYLETDYLKEPRYDAQALKSFSKISGELPTIGNAFEYFKNDIRKEIPTENLPMIYYYSVDPSDRHIVSARRGGAAVQHNNVNYNYQCPELDYTLEGRQICVIPDHNNPRRAYVFLYHIDKDYDSRVPEKDDVYYLGAAWDATIREPADISKLKLSRANRAHQEKIIKDAKDGVKRGSWSRYNGNGKAHNENAIDPSGVQSEHPTISHMIDAGIGENGVSGNPDSEPDTPDVDYAKISPELREYLDLFKIDERSPND